MISETWNEIYNKYFLLSSLNFIDPFEQGLDCNLTLINYIEATYQAAEGTLATILSKEKISILLGKGLSGISLFEEEVVNVTLQTMFNHYNLDADNVKFSYTRVDFTEVLDMMREDSEYDIALGAVVSRTNTYMDNDITQGCSYITPTLSVVGIQASADATALGTMSLLDEPERERDAGARDITCPRGSTICYLNAYEYGDMFDFFSDNYFVVSSEDLLISGLQDGTCDCSIMYLENLNYYKLTVGGYSAETGEWANADSMWLADVVAFSNLTSTSGTRSNLVPIFHADQLDPDMGNRNLLDAFSNALYDYAMEELGTGLTRYETLYAEVFGSTEFMTDITNFQGMPYGDYPDLDAIERGGVFEHAIGSKAVRVLELDGWYDGFHLPNNAGFGDMLLNGALATMSAYYGMNFNKISIDSEADAVTPSSLVAELVSRKQDIDMAFGSIVIEAETQQHVNFGFSYASQHYAIASTGAKTGIYCDDKREAFLVSPPNFATVADSSASRYADGLTLSGSISNTAASPSELNVGVADVFWLDAYFSYLINDKDDPVDACVVQFAGGSKFTQAAAHELSAWVNIAPAFRYDSNTLNPGVMDTLARPLNIAAFCSTAALFLAAAGVLTWRLLGMFPPRCLKK